MNIEEILLNKVIELSFNLLEMPGCIKLNTCNYKPSDKVELGFNIISVLSGDDIQSNMLSLIRDELSSSLTHKVLRNLNNTQLIDFIDKRGVGNIAQSLLSINKYIVSDIINYTSGYSNIVCSGSVASILQDDSRFYTDDSLHSRLKSGYMYYVGYISDIKVWVDPFMKYSNYKILAFDDVGVYVNNFYSKILSEDKNVSNVFVPKIIVGFDVDIVFDNVKKIYLITGKGCEGWELFMRYNKDSRIDNILDE